VIRRIIAYFRDIYTAAEETQDMQFALSEMKRREVRTAEHLTTYEAET